MRSLTSSSPWWSASRISRADFRSVESSVRDVPRQVQHGVQPGADPAALGALLAGPLELADLAQRGLAHLLGQVGGLDAGPVVIRPVRLALAQFLADRGQLLAQQELLLRLLHALADVVGDLVVDLDLGEVVAGPVDQDAQPLGRHRGSPAAAASAPAVRYDAYPAVSASADGSVSWLTKSTICQASRRCSIASSSFLYSAASARVSSVDAGFGRPRSPRPTARRRVRWRRRRYARGRSPRTTAAVPLPPATRPTCTIEASTP